MSITGIKLMSEYKITNYIFIDGKGKHMTRCWDKNGTYIVPTDPSQIRKEENFTWKPSLKPSTAGWRSGPMGATSGFRAKEDI